MNKDLLGTVLCGVPYDIFTSLPGNPLLCVLLSLLQLILPLVLSNVYNMSRYYCCGGCWCNGRSWVLPWVDGEQNRESTNLEKEVAMRI